LLDKRIEKCVFVDALLEKAFLEKGGFPLFSFSSTLLDP